ncbi:hypothetical protein M8818_002012 [Zalaria obscura]|uniref:Uncharacterized protein n=1 Tax=Zalaria obscura TaxID=2024903 RepID=A0ACC3SNA1_9PEZI
MICLRSAGAISTQAGLRKPLHLMRISWASHAGSGAVGGIRLDPRACRSRLSEPITRYLFAPLAEVTPTDVSPIIRNVIAQAAVPTAPTQPCSQLKLVRDDPSSYWRV